MSCTVCHRDVRIAAKGLCGACYQRMKTRGTTDYAPTRVRGHCSVHDCKRPHAARGYCDLHHQRVLTTGSPEGTKRPDDWGAKSKHPLFNRWQHLMRHKAQHAVVPEWSDFLTFAIDVGEPDDRRDKLYVADDSKPIGPGNFVWKRAVAQRVEGEDEATFINRRQRATRHVRAEAFAAYDVKRHYGLSDAQRSQMEAEQGGLCAICRRTERGQRFKRLSVDHCHASGAIRGLLCSHCNRGLGMFADDPARLRAAIEYLAKATPS